MCANQSLELEEETHLTDISNQVSAKTKSRICPFCRRLFLNENVLYSHFIVCNDSRRKLRSQVTGKIITAKTRLQCNQCDTSFPSEWHLIRHRVWLHHDMTEHSLSPLHILNDSTTHFDQQQISSIRDRWCQFILVPPSDYVSEDEE